MTPAKVIAQRIAVAIKRSREPPPSFNPLCAILFHRRLAGTQHEMTRPMAHAVEKVHMALPPASSSIALGEFKPFLP